MFRAFGFVLALVLCISGWSMARAAPKPETVSSLVKSLDAALSSKQALVHRNGPYKTLQTASWTDTLHRWAGVVKDLQTVALPPFALCGWWESCKNAAARTLSSWGNKNPKDDSHE